MAGDKGNPDPKSAEQSAATGRENPTSGSALPITSSASARRTYGTLDKFSLEATNPELRDDGQEESSTRAFTTQSANAPDKPRKPSLSRRMSSKRQIPHKGQGFSTDDDVDEVKQYMTMKQGSNTQQSPRIRPLRTQSSTLRRRPSVRPSPLARADSESYNAEETSLPEPDLDYEEDFPSSKQAEHSSGGNSEDDEGDDMQDDEDAASDAESFTLKDRQQAINETHPFGIRLWKPALYKKSRSVEKTAEGDIHSSPGGYVSPLLFLTNLLWSLFFGWWLALFALLAAVACFFFSYSSSAVAYGRVFSGLSRYLLYPFGSYVLLETDENYAEEDEGEGRSISEYEQWQNGDLEHGRLFFGPRRDRSLVGRRRNSVDSAGEQDSLLGRPQRGQREDSSQLAQSKRRLFGRGEWTLGRVVFFVFFYFLVGPLMLMVSLVCWLLVFWIPMGRITIILVSHLRRHPLALSFHSDSTYARSSTTTSSSSILLCTYRAAGTRYWKYTLDGTNIFLINLLGVVVFVIFDYHVLGEFLGLQNWLTHPALIFPLALLSIIPLAYFIGQAVASISAQSSMGLGAAINAFFSTIVEVYLYCVALTEGKAQLVEGSIIGSIFVGILFLPGLSMCFGALKRKTQRFNVKSAGVTSTMLLFAVIAAFGPTLFYQVYGSHELNCYSCVSSLDPEIRDCRRCYFSQTAAVNDQFFQKAVQPYAWIAAVFLFLSYCIGLWFTLRTHAALIWSSEIDEKKNAHATQSAQESFYEPRHLLFPNGQPEASGAASGARDSIRESQLYKRILGQSLKHFGLEDNGSGNLEGVGSEGAADFKSNFPHLVPPNSSGEDSCPVPKSVRGMAKEDNERLVRQFTEVAATAAAVAARDVARSRKPNVQHHQASVRQASRSAPERSRNTASDELEDLGLGVEPSHASGGHDAPNWSKVKSSVVLLGATLLYAVIAEILVNTVDVVLESVDIDEKFLGITLFALVPNTTEFLNAISFAMNGNIALSMEIGSAYALQVCLLQVPAVVFFSAFYGRSLDPSDLVSHSFNLIFPQWDMITVILCVFLLSYVYGEGKSNYFKGSVLVLTYLVVLLGFYMSGYVDMDSMGVDRFDTLAISGTSSSDKFYTIGRTRGGVAY
ncbi:Sodium/calcium exchanger membrane region [Penicillium cf. griseofulvum]|uniref:Sodium/calcium exchanger membrane region n=1 Tax=Penicillium cf. griseofulvum TaxID=2972120 RepID=A0A9W9T2R5_9EURO|nr:Sodium/calcium exchanger membrane region [Penicillium cf. griseofulvum]KAJ5446130.1 Sodium/calcium exchanger membrane region [Penicillium cf. griseofulvum]KAJ5447871.1 Sodium/calcium exchanger membrane region [Penicillium cf. griseofulvum]